jgi:hypothetical protein
LYDKQRLIKLVKDVYLECKIEVKNNIIYNKEAKTKLGQYCANTEIKKEIKEKLLEQKSSINLQTFVNLNIVDFQRVENSQIKSFYDTLEQNIYKFIESESKNYVERATLPSCYNIPLQEDYSVTKFLAYIRLITKSDIRQMKNFKNHEGFISDQEILIRSYDYGNHILATVKHIIFKETGSKSEELNIGKISKSTNYVSIKSMIDKLKQIYHVKDQQLALWVTEMLKGNIIKNLNKSLNVTNFQEKEIKLFVTSLTCLLFSTEVARNPASLVIHYMMLELIGSKKLKWNEGLTKIAMTLEKAVPASRWEHLNYKTSLKYNYDKSLNALAPEDQQLKVFIKYEAEIFKKWLELKEVPIGINCKIDEKLIDILAKLTKACEEWYQINLNIKCHMVADFLWNIVGVNYMEEPEPFSIEQMMELRNIVYSNKNSLIKLLKNKVPIEKIMEIFEKNQLSFNEYANEEVWGIANKEGLDFDDIYAYGVQGLINQYKDYIADRDYIADTQKTKNETFSEYLTRLDPPESSSKSGSSGDEFSSDSDTSSNSENESNHSGGGLFVYTEFTYWNIYTKLAMEKLLQLRLETIHLEDKIDTFSPNYVFDDSNVSALRLAKDITTKIRDTLLVNLNLHGKHWVGIVVEKAAGEINIHYMDPEQQAMPALLKKMLAETLAMANPEQRINITETELEPQKYNNCGPEVIENFMQYLTNHRLSQEDAVPVHALLYEDSIMLVGDC